MKLLLRIIRRLMLQIVVLIGVTFLTFLLIYLAPGDPVQILFESRGRPASDEVMDAEREKLGLDQPFIVQYGNWISDIVRGELGTSIITRRPVSEELKIYLPRTLMLAFFTMLLTALLSIPLGIFTASRADGYADRIILFISYLMVSIPSFFLALIVLYIFALKLDLFAIRTESLNGIIMPVAVMTAGMSGWYIRQVRTVILEQMKNEYVLGMRSRGIAERKILYGHVLKNSMVPIITLLGMSFGGMLGGTAIVECIFSWEGLGYWAVKAISARDYPVILGYVLWMAVIYILVNFIIEIVNTLIDPRLRRS